MASHEAAVTEIEQLAPQVMQLTVAMKNGHYLSMPFLLLFFVGYAYVGVLSVFQSR